MRLRSDNKTLRARAAIDSTSPPLHACLARTLMRTARRRAVQSVICPAEPGRQGRFAPGHLGELTQIVSCHLVDIALKTTRAVEHRVPVLPSRVGWPTLLLAGALFAEIGYQRDWARLVAGLEPAIVAAAAFLATVTSPATGRRCSAPRIVLTLIGTPLRTVR